MIQPQVSPDLITQHATGSSAVPLALCWPGSGVCSLSSLSRWLPTQTRQQSDFGPQTLDDAVGALSSADITESLASPSPRSQRLRLACRNQWVDPKTQRHTEKMSWHSFIWLKQDNTDKYSEAGDNRTCRIPQLSHTSFYEKVSGQSRFRRDDELLWIFTCVFSLKIET